MMEKYSCVQEECMKYIPTVSEHGDGFHYVIPRINSAIVYSERPFKTREEANQAGWQRARQLEDAEGLQSQAPPNLEYKKLTGAA